MRVSVSLNFPSRPEADGKTGEMITYSAETDAVTIGDESKRERDVRLDVA